MANFRILLAGAAAAGLIGAAVPLAAHADEAVRSSAATGTDQIVVPYGDGHLYAADRANGQGDYCKWSGSDNNWRTCRDGGANPRNMHNRATQVDNQMTYDVKLYDGLGYGGAWRCMQSNTHYDNLSLGREVFNRGSGSGLGQSMNNRISSHSRSANC
ncbi:peptidase inhibitor family I36 protein [Streptomyces synnematoformans]|uniref:Uncharacterized protein n=1 Tax=Streptomyces synnematoformans TaxID=415721 RepID=A0ABN2XV22_9ACTN